MEWVAGDNTKVVGTFPPRKRGWTGYVEKDTAGQTNIYSVEVSTSMFCNYISSPETTLFRWYGAKGSFRLWHALALHIRNYLVVKSVC